MLSRERHLRICLREAQGLVGLAYWYEGGPADGTSTRAWGTISLACPPPGVLRPPRRLQPHSPWLEARFQGSTQLGHQGLQARRR